MKAIKYGLILIVAVPLLAVIIGVALILTIDPNLFKPRIQSTLAAQGIESELQGDIGWQFFPNIGLRVENVTLRNQAKQNLVVIGVLDASVELMPLFSKEVIVKGIYLKDSTVYYTVGKNGENNWSFLTAEGDAPEQPDTAPSEESDAEDGALGAFNLQEIDVQNLGLVYRDESTGEESRVSGAYLRSSNIDLAGNIFPIELGTELSVEGLPTTTLSVSGNVAVNQAKSTFKIADGELAVLPGDAAIRSSLNIEMNWSDFTGKGNVRINPTELRPLFKALDLPLPETQSANAIRTLSGGTSFELTGDGMKLNDTNVTFDDFDLSGNTTIDTFSPLKMESHWTGTTLNVDNYLPPKSEEEKEKETAEAEPAPLPLQAIRDIDRANASLKLDGLTVAGLTMTNLDTQVQATKGVVTNTLSTGLAGGTVKSSTKFDANPAKGKLTFNASTTNVDVGQLAKTFGDTDHIAGMLNTQINGSAAGATDAELIKGLSFTAQASSQKVSVTPVNVEQQFCKAMAMVQGKQAPDFEWPNKTVMSDLDTLINFDNSVLKVSNLKASIAKLQTQANGTFNVDTGKFEFPIELSLNNFAGEIQGCLPITEKWRKRSIPILCEDTLSGIDYKTCLPNTKLIGRMIEDKLKAEAKEKVDAKKDELEDKAKEKAKEALEKNLGEEKAKELENKLKGLLNR